MPGDPLLAHALDFVRRKRRASHDVGQQCERRIRLVGHHRYGRECRVEARCAGKLRAEPLRTVGDRERVELAGSFVEQRHREARGTRLAALVADETAIEQQGDTGDGHARSRRNDHRNAVAELRALQLREDGVGKLGGHRRTGLAVDDVGRRRDVRRLGQHFERVITLREPLARDALQVRRLRGFDPFQRLAVTARIACIHLARGEHVGLAAEAADAFQAADEARANRDLRPLEFGLRRPLVDEALQFLHHRRLDARDRQRPV